MDHLRMNDAAQPKDDNSFAGRFGDWKTAQIPQAKTEQNSTALPSIALHDGIAKGTADDRSRSVVVVDKSAHKTHVLQFNNDRVEDVLTVRDATGKGPKMTPEGRFHITAKEVHPTWYPPPSIGGEPVGPGPDNPLGVAKIRTDAFQGRILMHGTNRPLEIGSNASHGCVRHHNEDIMKIYPLVQPGDAIYIVKSFNGTNIKASDFGHRR